MDSPKVGEWVGANSVQKVQVKCPKCEQMNEVMWFPPQKMTIQRKGTTGGSEKATMKKQELVKGTCTCGYVFSKKDFDEDSDIDDEEDDNDWEKYE